MKIMKFVFVKPYSEKNLKKYAILTFLSAWTPFCLKITFRNIYQQLQKCWWMQTKMFCFAIVFPVISTKTFLLLSFHYSSSFDRIFFYLKISKVWKNHLSSSLQLEQHCPPVFGQCTTAFTYLLSLWMLLMDSCIFNTSASKEAIA